MVGKRRDAPPERAHPEIRRYTHEELVAHAERLTGTKPEIARAALTGVSERLLSVDEFRRRCGLFLQSRIT